MTRNYLALDALANDIMAQFPNGISNDTQLEIDDIVHDWVEDNDDIDTGDETDPDIIADIHSNHASQINNNGPHEQIRALASWGMDRQEIIRLFAADAKLSNHARLAMKQGKLMNLRGNPRPHDSEED